MDPLVDNPLDLFEDAVLGVNGGRFRGAAYVNGEWYYTEGMEKEFADNGGQTLYMTVDGRLGVVENVDKNGNFIAEETIKDSELLPIEWEARNITAGDVRERVKRLWRLFMARNTPEMVTDTMRRYYEEYATKGKKAVKRHFEFQCFSTCGYTRAHDHSFQCWF